MRILAPKVHVEVFRPTQLFDIKKQTQKRLTSKLNPRNIPNELIYKRVVEIEDRRIKGLQFEETALFGGFLEINIAEDPQSELFDRFLPNDHVEVFYNDVTTEGDNIKNPIFNRELDREYNYTDDVPKFQGASWKSDLKYRQTMVTTQLHAWDYLRILQYINIPRGERKEKRLSTVVEPVNKINELPQLTWKTTRQKYADDMLDYIDSAVNTFVNGKGISIFGQQLLTPEYQEDGKTFKTIKFSPTGSASNRPENKPQIRFYNAGIGEHCNNKLRNNKIYSKFSEIYSNTNLTWTQRGYPYLTNKEQIIEKVIEAIDSMEAYDIMQFRILDGTFSRFKGLTEDGNNISDALFESDWAVDIIAISQFTLIELLIKKLTVDHNLNQWFTPIVSMDEDFLSELQDIGNKIGKIVSKLIYVRLREIKKDTDGDKESTVFCFNIDTYPFAKEFTTEAIKLAVANILRTRNADSSDSIIDKFSEIFLSVEFPQQSIEADKTYSLFNFLEPDDQVNSVIISHKDFLDKLESVFINNFTSSEDFIKSSLPQIFSTLMTNMNGYTSLIQKVLSRDDKMISFIKNVPASYMRADIYTGSKFNTIQYDSLAITRIIQLISSNIAGFPITNNPVSNTEKGKIDSYPIFAANRITIKPRAYFGKDITPKKETRFKSYQLYSSLTELYNKEKTDVKASCFLILDVAKKKLKEADEEPEFIFPLKDIQDFGIIKASTVNHYFNFSLSDFYRDFPLLANITDDDKEKDIYSNVAQNGIFIEYIESGVSSVGFSPPEHQQLKLEDLTQDSEYNSWYPRFVNNTNIDYKDNDKPVFNPRTAYIINENEKNNPNIQDNRFMINDYDNFDSFEIISKPLSQKSNNYIFVLASDGTTSIKDFTTINPYHGIISYCDISDLKAEYKTLELILNDEDLSYRDISNVDLELMENIKLRVPLIFSYDKNASTYDEKIKLLQPKDINPIGASKVFETQSLKTIINNINKELDKIEETDMMWLFPIDGFKISDIKSLLTIQSLSSSGASSTHQKHLFLVTYLDLLVKGIRYLLWSLAKARYFSHIYIPIEYNKYYTRKPKSSLKYVKAVEPGSSVQIHYEEDNSSLFRSIDNQFVAYPIKGLEKSNNSYLPLYRSISRGEEKIKGSDKEYKKEPRIMTWYVSKKVTYIGADTGAMMRLEMTEGSLDWTLFYNEKNLLTQVSEHYLLNGLGNFRTGVF